MSHCMHPDPGSIRKFKKGGIVYFGLQCKLCLKLVGPKLSPTELEGPEGRLIPGEVPWAEKKKPFRGEGNSKKKAYNAYMRSPAWRRKRSQRLEMDSYTCQMCYGSGEEVDRLEVDHIRYDNFGKEPMRDLQTLCSECHTSLTEQRIGGGS